MRTPRKEFGTPKTPSRYGSKNNDPHLRRMLSPALVTPDAETINERQKLEDSSALLQPHSSSWLVNAQRKLEDPNIKGFSLSTLASIPDWYYCCALHTGLASVAPKDWDLGQKLWLAVCYLTVVGSLILIRCLKIDSPY